MSTLAVMNPTNRKTRRSIERRAMKEATLARHGYPPLMLGDNLGMRPSEVFACYFTRASSGRRKRQKGRFQAEAAVA